MLKARECPLCGVSEGRRDRYIAEWDQVCAVWGDGPAPSGLYFLSIKGEGAMAKYRRSCSVPCVDREEVLRPQARYGGAADVASSSQIWVTPATIPRTN